MGKQTLEERLNRTLVAMQRCDEDSPIDICHFQAINDAIKLVDQCKAAGFIDEKGGK